MISVHFTNCLEKETRLLSEINQKLLIVDNLLLINSVTSKINEFHNVIKYNSNINPEENKAKNISYLAYESLYSPLFTMEDKTAEPFNDMMFEMKRLCSVYSERTPT